MKKISKIIAITFLIIVLIFISIPLLFKKQITEIVTQEVNNAINATVSFDDLSISFLKQFPSAAVTLSDFLITSEAPFEGDTLFFAEKIQLNTAITDLISNKPKIKNFSVDKALLQIITDSNGISNYDIAKKTTQKEAKETNSNTSSNFSLEIESYSFNRVDFNYIDKKSKMKVAVKNFNHQGNGQFSSNNMLLSTISSIDELTVTLDKIDYLNKVKISLDAALDVDLETTKVTFKKNKALLNDLEISFNGFVQSLSTGLSMGLDFSTTESKFKSLLSLVPSAYSSNFKNITAQGALNLKGNAHGSYTQSEIPKFSILINTNDASFKYPDLPKSVEHIHINSLIENTSGKIDDTKIEIKKFGFQIDKDIFSATSTITKLTSNPTVKAKLVGVVNLANLSKAYPIGLNQKFQGILKANLKTSFNQNAIEKNQYQQIKNSGTISLKDFTTSTDLLPNPITISQSNLVFNTKDFSLTDFKAKTGTSDLSIKGSIHNLYGYIFGDKDLKGNFKVSSEHLNIADLLSASDTIKTVEKDTIAVAANKEALKIPTKIDALVQIQAATVLYDNLTLKDVKGTLKIKDQKATFEKTTAKMLGGSIAIDGGVNTQPTPSDFNLKLNIKNFDIASSFNTLELFSSVAPFAQIIDGKMSTSFNLSGLLNNDFFPDTQSLEGDALANLEVTEVDTKKSKAMNLLDDKLSFIDFSKLDLKKIKAQFNFAERRVEFKPFKIASYDGVPITMSGAHTFDNEMDYKVTLDIPAKYLGNDVASLLSGLSATEKNKISVPFTINIGGAITKPIIQPDMKAVMTALTTKIVSSQKNKLIDKLLGGNNQKKDSTATPENNLKKAASKLLKNLFK